ncbi:bile acid:sodium symporter family protein [Oleiharenicola lentus]|uniref:bile acid:sodium symporter family protein n=1 Tax=Oleiharenicola lentus TaxID=2508720 RepID=UPI003F680B5F
MLPLRKFCLYLVGPALLALLIGVGLANPSLWKPAAVVGTLCLAIGLGAAPKWKGYQYTVWILAAVVAAMVYPSAFLRWGEIDLRNKWLVLVVVQLVMFGMGTQMSLHDFAGVAKAPRGVLVGILCHFSVMPIVGWLLTKVFHFEPEIAAGIILIGSCSSGLASNVMTFIAKANLPLSVTVTAVTTLVAPIMTPLLMKLLAGTLVEVKFMNMMIEIIKIVIVPIAAALIHDYLKHATPARLRRWAVAQLISAAGAAVILITHDDPWALAQSPSVQLAYELIGFALGAVAFGVTYHQLTRRFTRLDGWMPVVSMAGIVYFTTVTTAAGRDNLLKVGALLFLASAIHNAAGYFFGYWLSRSAGLDKNSARSVAFEVGLQNGGMASGLAGSMGKLATVGLAAAIFSPWMNITGSILANYWKNRPVGPGLTPDEKN